MEQRQSFQQKAQEELDIHIKKKKKESKCSLHGSEVNEPD